ncbi:MAG: class I SAM-dependent methyltransferase [Saccharospirillum sp.]|nr:class I SAM-dependent methyltransferase [Saccharospirillum sp.]
MWDQRYSSEHYVYGTEPNDFLREQSGLLAKGGRVLCLAEGEGRNAVFLAALGMEVTAVDASEVGLAKARRLADEKGVHIHTEQVDLADYDPGHERWDAVVSIFCHLPSVVRQRLHQQLVNALKPGGLLILEAYRPEQLDYKTGGPSSAEMMMTEATLKAELDGLHFDLLESTVRPVIEGTGHTGQGAVVRLLALKA